MFILLACCMLGGHLGGRSGQTFDMFKLISPVLAIETFALFRGSGFTKLWRC